MCVLFQKGFWDRICCAILLLSGFGLVWELITRWVEGFCDG